MKKLFFLITVLALLMLSETTFAYTAQKEDTMINIAKENDLPLDELAIVNPHISDHDLIYIGKQLLLHKKNQSLELNKENFSEKELDLLARVVRAEAQTEPFEGKVAVADVVLNRVESPEFPNTVREVIYEPGQFQPIDNGQIDQPADEESVEAVNAALSDMRNISDDSLFFYNPDIATNRWLDTRETTVVIGDHVFKQ